MSQLTKTGLILPDFIFLKLSNNGDSNRLFLIKKLLGCRINKLSYFGIKELGNNLIMTIIRTSFALSKQEHDLLRKICQFNETSISETMRSFAQDYILANLELINRRDNHV